LLDTDQDNLRMQFLAINVDFCSFKFRLSKYKKGCAGGRHIGVPLRKYLFYRYCPV